MYFDDGPDSRFSSEKARKSPSPPFSFPAYVDAGKENEGVGGFRRPPFVSIVCVGEIVLLRARILGCGAFPFDRDRVFGALLAVGIIR